MLKNRAYPLQAKMSIEIYIGEGTSYGEKQRLYSNEEIITINQISIEEINKKISELTTRCIEEIKENNEIKIGIADKREWLGGELERITHDTSK